MLKFDRAAENDDQVDPLVNLRCRMAIPREGAALQVARNSLAKIAAERQLARDAHAASLHVDRNRIGGASLSDKTRQLEQAVQEKDAAVKKARADLQAKREAHGQVIAKALSSGSVEYEQTVSHLLAMLADAIELGFDVQSRCQQYDTPLPRSIQAAAFMHLRVRELRHMFDGGL